MLNTTFAGESTFVQRDNITVMFEQQTFQIPINLEEPKDKILYSLFNKLQQKVDKLERELKNEILISDNLIEKKTSDLEAKEEITKYLQDTKKKGITKVNIVDMVLELHLPANQIEKIMDSLEGKQI